MFPFSRDFFLFLFIYVYLYSMLKISILKAKYIFP